MWEASQTPCLWILAPFVLSNWIAKFLGNPDWSLLAQCLEVFLLY